MMLLTYSRKQDTVDDEGEGERVSFKSSHPAPANCPHDNTWFDRSLCSCVEGGIMHTVCADCDAILDNGGHEAWLGSLEDEPAILLRDTPEDRERLIKVVRLTESYATEKGALDCADAIIAALRQP